MNKIVLFIRDHGAADVLDFYPDEATAQQALAAYVAEKIGQVLPLDPDAARARIDRYFDGDHTFYTIAGVPAGAR